MNTPIYTFVSQRDINAELKAALAQRDELLAALRQVRDFGTLAEEPLDFEYCYNDMRRIADAAIARAEHNEGKR